MGRRPKALLALGGRSFLELVAASARAAAVDGIVVVVGHHRDAILPHARALADLVAHNDEPDRGMGSSVREAARAIPADAAMLVWPVDVPRARAETVAALVGAGRERPGSIVVPTSREGRGGHPTLLPPSAVARVRAMADHDRLDHLIEAGPEPVHRLLVDDPGVLCDVDDLAALRAARRGP
jgi:CTP:molybdopterin cytidylyltransferase MocA